MDPRQRAIVVGGIIAVVLVVAGFLVVSAGGDDTTASPTTVSETVPTTSAEPTTTAAAPTSTVAPTTQPATTLPAETTTTVPAETTTTLDGTTTTTDGTTSTTGPTTSTTAPGDTTTTTDGATTTTTVSTTTTVLGDTVDLDDPGLYDEPATSYRSELAFEYFSLTEVDGEEIELFAATAGDGGKLGRDRLLATYTEADPGDDRGCVVLSDRSSFVDAYDSLLRGLLTGTAPLQEAGLIVNGKPVNRYRLTAANIVASNPLFTIEEFFGGWVDVAIEGGYIVRSVVSVTGTASISPSPNVVGDVDYVVDFSEFGTISRLTSPPGC